jgi:hypothetical protein
MRGGSDGSGSGLDVGISGDLACMISSSHDLEVRAWISRMQRLSARAQGSKGSDSKPSMSAIRLLQQQGGAWQCGAVRAGAVRRQQACAQGRSAGESGLCVRLIAARVSSITRHRAAGFRAMQAEAKAARAGEAFLSCVLLLLRRAVGSGRQGKTVCPLGVAVCPFRSRTKFDLGSTSCSYKKSCARFC